ncbi:MAG: radical SAM family heme chaperone HemW [Coriobacteriales bacterium]|jgi:oxygen-independent coproporphyrinogen-3 oxidase
MRDSFKSLYLHVPFCVRRCAYCDFQTSAVPVDDPAIDSWLSNMGESLGKASSAGMLDGVETIYIGGGTPSYLGEERLATLLHEISEALDLKSLREFSIEANPDSFTEGVADVLEEGGVSRISLGLQSLDDEVLQTLGRVHDAETARNALGLACSKFGNVSADVICGVMGQSEESLSSTLHEVVSAGVSHVSIYPLMVEEGTPLAKKVEEFAVPGIDEGKQADHMELAEQVLAESGFHRYEVASYCKPDAWSRHNVCYWTGKPYLGLGPGASSMMGSRDLREVLSSGALDVWNPRVQQAVTKASFECESWDCDPVRARVSLSLEDCDVELLSARESACEDAMLSMRMSIGMGAGDFKRFAAEAPSLESAAQKVVDEGLAEWLAPEQIEAAGKIDTSILEATCDMSEDRLVPTHRGWLMGNELYGEFWACASD